MAIVYEKDDYFLQSEFLYNLCVESNDNRELLTNLIIIDVVTSFEVYIERLLKQFIKKYNMIGLPSCRLNKKIKIECSKKIIKQLQVILEHEHKEVEASKKLIEISDIWSEGKEITVDLETKYPRGKHGEVQFSKLFQKVGIDNIFCRINVESNEESMVSEDEFNISNFVQEITTKRNLAIHEGVPLHNRISLENLRKYIDITDKILNELTRVVNEELDSHQALLNT